MSCRVATIVLNWNGWRDTLACLESLRPVVDAGLSRVILVDNCSTDESVARLREWLQPKGYIDLDDTAAAVTGEAVFAGRAYALIRAPRNLGYAAGNNLGIRLALRLSGTEFVFLLNNDTSVEPQSVAQLLEFADQNPSAGILGSTIVEADGIRIAGGSRYNRLLTTSTPALALDSAAAPAIDYVSGAAMFIRTDALLQAGLLNEEYFLYFEELDFTHRVVASGLQVRWCPSSIVYHKVGQTAGSRTANQKKSQLSEYHSNLSCLIYTRKFHPQLFWLAASLRFLLKLVHDLIHRQIGLVGPMAQAYRDFWLRLRQLKA